MKRLLPAFLFAIISLATQAQNFDNSSFYYFDTIPCPLDTLVTIVTPKSWTLYQTINDLWDGPKDSTVCITAGKKYSHAAIALNQVDTTRHLFIASAFDTSSNNYPTETNWIYEISASLDKTNNSSFSVNASANCNPGPCSYLLVRLEIPDSNFILNGTAFRQHVLAFDSLSGFYTQKCFPTEKFDTNYIRQGVMALRFNDVSVHDTLILWYCYAEPQLWTNPVTEIIATLNGNTYEYHFPFYIPSLLIYTEPTYPSLSNLSYVTVTPYLYTDTIQQLINVYIDDFTEVVFQPYVYLRGSEVELQEK